MAMTKAATTKPLMIKGKLHLKNNKGGEKTNSSDNKLVYDEKKSVQKTDNSDNDFEEKIGSWK
jgi:hypothetical protein